MKTELSDNFGKTKVSEICILLLFIFSLKFIFSPLNTTQLVVGFMLCSGVLVWKKVYFFYSVTAMRHLFPFLILAAYVTLSTLLISGRSIANMSNIFLIVFQVIIGAYLVTFFFFNDQNQLTVERLLFLLLIVFGLQGFFILLNFAIPAYRDFMFKILPMSGNIEAGTTISLFRVRGLTQGTGASVSAFISYGFLIGGYFLAVGGLGNRDRAIIYVCLFFIFIGLLFTGRTGLLMIPLSALLYYMILLVKRKFTWRHLSLIVFAPVIVAIIYLTLKGIYMLVTDGGIILPNGTDLLAKWEGWAFGEFMSYFDGRDSSVHTLSILRSFLFIPVDDRTFLFGDPGTWSVVRSDIGYIRNLFALGVFGASLNYIAFASVYFYMLRTAKVMELKLFLAASLTWQAFIEMKEPLFNNLMFVSFIMLLFFVTMRNEAGAPTCVPTSSSDNNAAFH